MLWAIINFMFHSVSGQFLLLEFFKISNTAPLILAKVGLVPLSSPYFNLPQGARLINEPTCIKHMTVMQGFKYVAWISRIVSEMSLRTRSHVSEYVWIRNFFFRDSKISTSRRIRIQIGFAHPHVSDTYPDSLYYPGLLCENWQQSMRRKALKICILLCLERTWERSWHLNYSIHGKELSSILLRHRITKFPDLASTRFRIHGVFKNFLSGERIQKVVDSYAGFTDTCRRKPYPERKSCGFKSIRIRADGQRRFWATHVNRKWGLLPFYMPWR